MGYFSRFLQPGQGLPPMVRSTLILVVAIVVVGLVLDGGYIDIEDPDKVTLTAQFGPLEGEIYPLIVIARVQNISDEPMSLTSPNPCDVFRWFLLDENNDFIQSKPQEACTQVAMSTHLAPGKFQETEFILPIDARRVEPGGNLRLRYRYWGIEGQTKFVFELPQ